MARIVARGVSPWPRSSILASKPKHLHDTEAQYGAQQLLPDQTQRGAQHRVQQQAQHSVQHHGQTQQQQLLRLPTCATGCTYPCITTCSTTCGGTCITCWNVRSSK